METKRRKHIFPHYFIVKREAKTLNFTQHWKYQSDDIYYLTNNILLLTIGK